MRIWLTLALNWFVEPPRRLDRVSFLALVLIKNAIYQNKFIGEPERKDGLWLVFDYFMQKNKGMPFSSLRQVWAVRRLL